MLTLTIFFSNAEEINTVQINVFLCIVMKRCCTTHIYIIFLPYYLSVMIVFMIFMMISTKAEIIDKFKGPAILSKLSPRFLFSQSQSNPFLSANCNTAKWAVIG